MRAAINTSYQPSKRLKRVLKELAYRDELKKS